MTQIFEESGDIVPVTVIETGDNFVVQVKSADGPDGYDAVQLGIDEQKPSRLTKPEVGHYKKAGLEPCRFLAEIRVAGEDLAKYPAGGVVKAGDVFKVGDRVDVTGTSKGRGFAGVMKRYSFKGFERSHGTHEFFRHGGSIGTRLTPGHVIKGKRMGGHMGDARTTVQNLEIARIDAEKGLLYVTGGIPGARGGLVVVRLSTRG
jgi:large subunit ribosomal protein L3